MISGSLTQPEQTLKRNIHGEGEITSHSTTEVIEPYRKHFESNCCLPPTTPPTTILVFEGNTWDDIGKSIKVNNKEIQGNLF